MSRKKVFLIAEVAQAHEGSLGIAHSYIDALAQTGIDAIKFQTHIALAESSPQEPFRVNFSYEDETREAYWKRMEFTPAQWKGLKEHCDKAGLEFISSPFSVAAVNMLEEIGVKQYKIGSGDVSNLLLVKKVAMTGKPVILSSGMSSLQELKVAAGLLKASGNSLSILQCTTAYPTKPEQWGLNVITELANQFRVPVGFSDHSGEIYACLAAAALGAAILEFHVVFDKRMFGPDSTSSLTIDQVFQLVKGVRSIEKALGSPILKGDADSFSELKRIFGKSLSTNKALSKGSRIAFDDLESKKPAGEGIPSSGYDSIVGKLVKRDLPAWSFLKPEDLE